MNASRSVVRALAALCAAFGMLAVGLAATGATALAAAPETPETLAASAVTGSSAILHGVLNPGKPGEPGSYYFDYWPSATECEHEFQPGSFEFESTPSLEAEGKQREAVQATVTGLLPETTYTACLVAQNEGGTAMGSPETFTTLPAAPTVSSEDVLSVGSSEATVTATVQPGGLPASYRVEYGKTAAYGSSTLETSAGAGNQPVALRVRLTNLEPAAEYHFRFLAANELGAAEGEDHTFTTAASAGSSSSTLPDNRVYELVSPPTNNQGVDSPDSEDHGSEGSFSEDESAIQPFLAAEDGNAIVYPGEPSLEGGSGSFGGGASNEWLATRGATGWSASDITPPGTIATDYDFFSSDLTAGVFFANGGVPIAASPLSPDCNNGDEANTNIYLRSADGSYHALIAKPAPEGGCGQPAAADASGDDSHLLFEDSAALTPGAVAAIEREKYNIYDSVEGKLYQVNILPDGRPEGEPGAWLGGPPAEEAAAANFDHAVSFSGTRIFWSSVEEGNSGVIPKALYVRENDTAPQSPIAADGRCEVAADACTLQIDAGEPQCVAEGKCKGGGGVFWTASSDGSKVFFADENRLTANSTAAAGAPDLYEYEVNSEAGAPGRVVDLTAEQGGGQADVQGVLGASVDGSDVYFVADGVLTGTPNAERKSPVAGEPNLYLSKDGTITFVATLSGNDDSGPSAYSGEGAGDWSHGFSERTAEVTPDGSEVVFESVNDLTGYDNLGPSGDVKEVFVYDATTQSIACASCSPTGVPPNAPASFTGVALLPVPGGGGENIDEYAQRWIADDGSRVFFQTAQPLVPQDTNGRVDVYEWERNGAGSCAPAAAGERERGCVYLISGGQSTDNSFLASMDAEGNDVFFTSRGELTPQAADENIAMYDARVDGGFPELSTACTGTGCQGVPPAPPIFATPASVTFDGVGNFEPGSAKPVSKAKSASRTKKKKTVRCRRGERASHGKCAKKSKRKAKTDRRAKRGRTR